MLRRPQPLNVLACTCLVVLAGCSGGGSGYESPEACFEGIKTAVGNEDYKTALNGLTDETQTGFAGLLVMAGAGIKAMGGMAAMMGGDDPEAKKMMEAVTAIGNVLNEHGATDAKLQSVMGEGGMMGMMMSGGPSEEKISELAGVVDDKAQFIVDMIEAFMKLDSGQGPDPKEIIEAVSKAQLSDVKIEGDQATAKVTISPPDGSAPETEDVEFRKTDAGWKMHLDPESLQGEGSAEMDMDMEMGEGEFDMGEFEMGEQGEDAGDVEGGFGDDEGGFGTEMEEDVEVDETEEAATE